MQDIRFTESLVRRAARRSVLRLLGPLFFIAAALVAASVALGLLRGDRGWFLGVIATILVLAIATPLAAIRAHTRAGLEKFRGLEDGKASIDLSAGRLQVASRLGTLDAPLTQVTKVWRYPDYWVLLSGMGILMTVPLQGVPSDVTDAWTEELRAAGARLA